MPGRDEPKPKPYARHYETRASMFPQSKFPRNLSPRKRGAGVGEAKSSTDRPAGPRPRGYPQFMSRPHEGRAGGRKADLFYNGWPSGRPRAVIFWPISATAYLTLARPAISCRLEPSMPWVFQPRRGGCRTPECGCVTPTAKLAPVPPFDRTSIHRPCPRGIPRAPLLPPRWQAGLKPRVPLEEERSEYRRG
jgi:hypothetical protein